MVVRGSAWRAAIWTSRRSTPAPASTGCTTPDAGAGPGEGPGRVRRTGRDRRLLRAAAGQHAGRDRRPGRGLTRCSASYFDTALAGHPCKPQTRQGAAEADVLFACSHADVAAAPISRAH